MSRVLDISVEYVMKRIFFANYFGLLFGTGS